MCSSLELFSKFDITSNILETHTRQYKSSARLWNLKPMSPIVAFNPSKLSQIYYLLCIHFFIVSSLTFNQHLLLNIALPSNAFPYPHTIQYCFQGQRFCRPYCNCQQPMRFADISSLYFTSGSNWQLQYTLKSRVYTEIHLIIA